MIAKRNKINKGFGQSRGLIYYGDISNYFFENYGAGCFLNSKGMPAKYLTVDWFETDIGKKFLQFKQINPNDDYKIANYVKEILIKNDYTKFFLLIDFIHNGINSSVSFVKYSVTDKTFRIFVDRNSFLNESHKIVVKEGEPYNFSMFR